MKTKNSTTAGMADRGWKADLNWKLNKLKPLENLQWAENDVTVAGATSSVFLVFLMNLTAGCLVFIVVE